MFPPNTWVFDLEILNPIPQYKKGVLVEALLPSIRYCKNWGDHFGMGVSVLVAARIGPMGEFLHGEVYIGDNTAEKGQILHRFNQTIFEADLIIGHASRFFDAKVLAARGIYIPAKKHLDFHHEVKKATGKTAPKGYNLEALSTRCGGPPKIGDGALAPILWQQGHRQLVTDYCKNDIMMTVAIAAYYANNGCQVPQPTELNLPHLLLRSPSQLAMDME